MNIRKLLVFLGVALCIIVGLFALSFDIGSKPNSVTTHMNAFLPAADAPRAFSDNFDWDWDTVTIHRRVQDITYQKNAALLDSNLLSGFSVNNRSYLVFRKKETIVKIVSYPLSVVFYDDSGALIQVGTYQNEKLFYSTEQDADGCINIRLHGALHSS